MAIMILGSWTSGVELGVSFDSEKGRRGGRSGRSGLARTVLVISELSPVQILRRESIEERLIVLD
jgi:hypothetical protein